MPNSMARLADLAWWALAKEIEGVCRVRNLPFPPPHPPGNYTPQTISANPVEALCADGKRPTNFDKSPNNTGRLTMTFTTSVRPFC